jgi:hypothetical protein
MTPILLIHLLALGLWVGCIATETVFEHTTGKEPGMAAAIARLHVKVDLWVETPAFLVVLASGGSMYGEAAITPLFGWKILTGLAAIAVNAFCVWVVLARHGAMVAGDLPRAERLDDWQHKSGALLVVLIALALALAAIDRF